MFLEIINRFHNYNLMNIFIRLVQKGLFDVLRCFNALKIKSNECESSHFKLKKIVANSTLQEIS